MNHQIKESSVCCGDNNPTNSQLIRRIEAVEETAKITMDMREAVKNLADNVFALHQAVIKMSDDKNSVMPRSVRIAIIAPSVLVTFSSIVWIYEHILSFTK